MRCGVLARLDCKLRMIVSGGIWTKLREDDNIETMLKMDVKFFFSFSQNLIVSEKKLSREFRWTREEKNGRCSVSVEKWCS